MLWIWFSAPAFLGHFIFVCTSLHEILLQDFSGLAADTDAGVLVRKWKTVHVLHETVSEHYFCWCKSLDFHRYFLLLVSSIRPTCDPTLAHSAFIPWRCEGSKSPNPMRHWKRNILVSHLDPWERDTKSLEAPHFLLLNRFELKLSSYYLWFIQNTERYVLRNLFFSVVQNSAWRSDESCELFDFLSFEHLLVK